MHRSDLLSLPDRIGLWLHRNAYSLTLGLMLVLVVWLLSACNASAQAAQELAAAQARMEQVRLDPSATDEDWKQAVLALAKAQGLYIDAVGHDAEGWLTELPASAEGGLFGVAAAALLYVVRQRSRSRLEDELERTHQVANRALREATEARRIADPMADARAPL